MNPNTVVTLYATDFDISNRYVVKAESEGEALGAVSSFPSKVYPDCYWQRDASAFRATGNINDVKKYNYCTFDNNGKLNFAFITDFTYINDDMTLCHIEIDPWLNYAGQYKFGYSPMLRCHPKVDSVIEGSSAAEPLQISRWKQKNTINGEYTTGDADDMFLVTQIDVASAPLSADNMINGIFDLLSYYGAQTASTLTGWANMALRSVPCRVGQKVQATTYHVDRSTAQTILQKMSVNGLADKVICCYHIPSYFGASSIPKSGSPLTMINDNPENTESIVLDYGGYTIFWNKIKYSPQFNQLVINLCGNAKEIPWGIINPNDIITGNLKVKINSDCSMDGCATARLENIYTVASQSSDFIVKSPMWDRVQMVGTGANQNKLVVSEYATLSGMIKAGISYLSGQSLLSSSLLNIGEANIKSRANRNTIANEGTVVTGGGGGSITGYNRTAPLFNAAHYFPSENDMVKIQEYFGTYGYSWDGRIKPIEFGYMPHWNYYETENANITGREVPQKDLMKIINRFNDGIFVFNTIGDYKKFENCMANHL